jgi:hypothetical protein
VDKAGVCIKCWKIFRTGDELLAHLTYTCRTSTLSNLGKHAILYDAFAKPTARWAKDAVHDGLGKTAAGLSMSNTTQASPDTQKLPSANFPSGRPELEEKFLRDFTCCGKAWPMLHDLLQHYEEDHVRDTDHVRDADHVQDDKKLAFAKWPPRLKLPVPRTLEASMPGGSVPFPQDLDQTLIDSDELFDPSFTITSTSPSQTVASQQPEVTLTQKLQVSTLRARDYHTDDKHTASPSPTPSPPSSSTQQPAALPHFQGNSSTAIDFDGKSQQPSAVHSPLPPNRREGHLPGDSDEAERRRNIGELQDSPGDCLPEAPYSLFSDNIATNAVPRIDRSMTDVYSDELYNPHFTMTSAPIASTPTSQALPPMNKFFADRLQAANSQHLSAVHALAPSRGRSLFLQGSPLAPEPADDLSTTMPPPPVVPRSGKQEYKVPQFPVNDPVKKPPSSYRLDDDLMLPTDHAPLHYGKSYVTDLDIQTLQRAEELYGATEDKGLWVSDDPADEELEKMLEVGPHEGVTGQSQHGRMEVVYCHGCSREWYREQQADLECPHCHGNFCEIVDVAPATATDTKGDEAVARPSSAQGPAVTPEDQSSDMMLLDQMSAPTTIPIFGPTDSMLNKSPYEGMPEDFMAYLFNTNGAQPDHGSLKKLAVPPSTLPGPPMLQEKQEHVLQAKLDLEKLEELNELATVKYEEKLRMLLEEGEVQENLRHIQNPVVKDVDTKDIEAMSKKKIELVAPARSGNSKRRPAFDAIDTADDSWPDSTTRLPLFQSPKYAAANVDDMAPIQPLAVDPVGEMKVQENGQLLGGRRYRMRTFLLPEYGDRLFMLAEECRLVLGFTDLESFFAAGAPRFGVTATEEMINIAHGLPRYVGRQTQVFYVVTARDIFQRFGSRAILHGEAGRDDYLSLPSVHELTENETDDYDQWDLKHRMPRSPQARLEPTGTGLEGARTTISEIAQHEAAQTAGLADVEDDEGIDVKRTAKIDTWRSPTSKSAPASETHLPCPFQRRNPRRYRLVKDPACSGHGFKEIADLMDHIKRSHSSKWGCRYCKARFQGRDNAVEDMLKLHRKDCKWYGSCGVAEVDQHMPEVMSPHQDKLYFQIDFRHMKGGYLAEDKQWLQYWYICMAIWPEYESLDAFKQFYPSMSTLLLRLEL